MVSRVRRRLFAAAVKSDGLANACSIISAVFGMCERLGRGASYRTAIRSTLNGEPRPGSCRSNRRDVAPLSLREPFRALRLAGGAPWPFGEGLNWPEGRCACSQGAFHAM
jgi:hypothetical protein